MEAVTGTNPGKTRNDAEQATAKNLLDEKQAAEYLDLQPATLAVWRSTGRWRLPFIKMGRYVRYRRSDLDSWIASRTRTATE
jgi:excisionase family DNA binding protein